MAGTRNVAVLVGSLRKGSFNRKAANALAALAPAGLRLKIVEIGQLVLYNQDLDETPPAEWVAFREEIKAAERRPFRDRGIQPFGARGAEKRARRRLAPVR